MQFYTKFLCLLILILLGGPSPNNSENILLITLIAGKSHQNIYEPLLGALATRGHSVTVITSTPLGITHPNIKEFIGIPAVQLIGPTAFLPFEVKESGIRLNPLKALGGPLKEQCANFYKVPSVQATLRQKWDLVLGSAFMNECVLGAMGHLGAPFILIQTFTAPPWITDAVGNPAPYSITPYASSSYSDRMTFLERVDSFIQYLKMDYELFINYYPGIEVVYREALNNSDLPTVPEIQRNTALLFSNSHFSINKPRPMMPDLIDIGGMHCRDSKPLPKDLNDYLTGAGPDGVIYFSLGSVVQGSTMPDKYRKIFLKVFSKLKQRVLWKWETETMPDLPSNVKLVKWAPQQDILGHPAVKIFMTHGGLLSTEEAIYHGVPLIGFPIFGDQNMNMRNAESEGYAISVELPELTEEILSEAIQRVLTNSSYSNRIKELSKVFKDRPQKPLDLAVYWTEYVIRHKGAKHLRSPARELNLFQYHSLDVISFLLGVALVTLGVIYVILRFTLSLIFGCIFSSVLPLGSSKGSKSTMKGNGSSSSKKVN